MLHIYLDKIPSSLQYNLVNDVEKQFAGIRLACTDKEKKVVKEIEKGILLDSYSYIDRFGYKLYTSELSTGCKAALCVLNFPDKIINLAECGLNARDCIVSFCDLGAVLIDSNTITFSGQYTDEKISVAVDEYVFISIDSLNKYIFNERPFESNMFENRIDRTGEFGC